MRLPGTDDIFPGVDYRDRMHGMLIFLHRVIFTMLNDLVETSAHRRILDQRLTEVCKRHFRREGKCIKSQKSIFTDVGMTAVDKADVIFLLSHVLGPGPDDIIGDRVYMPLATAVAQAQRMLIAARGRRSYSKEELVDIFDKGFVLLFGALESVRQASYEQKVQKWAMGATVNPPKRFKRMSRVIQSHTTPVSDTDDTDEDDSVGGLGFYSHSHFCYTHQHWVDQLISSGGFNVHCTQAAEASHKLNMHLASKRVRHFDANQTQDSMLKYLCDLTTFGELAHWLKLEHVPIVRKIKHGLRCPLTCSTFKDSIGNKFLHREVRLTEIEVANLVCQKLHLPLNDTPTHERLKALTWQFSQKLLRQDGRTFWASNQQRDILRFKPVDNGNCLCGEAVCFVSICNVKDILPENPKDSLTFCLIRYLRHHPDSWERDHIKRPVCPGPFHVNNCLWQYAATPSRRVSLLGRNGRGESHAFQRYRDLFGNSENEQTQCRLRELNAWYALMDIDSIEDTMNMCPLFKRNSSNTHYESWLETVTML